MEGITKYSVMQIASDLGYQIVEREIPRTEIYFSDEIFLTGTAAEITPVIAVDGKKVGDGKIGKITAKIKTIYSDITMAKNKKYSKWITPVY